MKSTSVYFNSFNIVSPQIFLECSVFFVYPPVLFLYFPGIKMLCDGSAHANVPKKRMAVKGVGLFLVTVNYNCDFILILYLIVLFTLFV